MAPEPERHCKPITDNKTENNKKHYNMNLHLNNLIRSAAALLCGASLFACSDLSELEERVDDLDSRVQALENQAENLNSTIGTIQTLLDDKLFITKIEETADGYTLTMSDDTKLNIVPGEIGNNPLIAVDDEGYWIVSYDNGENFDRIKVDGEQDMYVSAKPLFRVNADGNWEVSTDGGKTYDPVYYADTTDPVPASSEGDSFFKGVSFDEESNTITLTLADGNSYSFSVSTDFVCSIGTTESPVIFSAGIPREFDVTVKGVAEVYIVTPTGWEAVLEDLPADPSTESTIKLTVTPPAGDTPGTRVSADTEKDIILHATAAASDRSIFAKMTVELSDAAMPEVAIELGEVTAESISYTLTPNGDVTSWKYMLLPASETAPATAEDFNERATEGNATELALTQDANGNDIAAGTTYILYVLAVNNENGEVTQITASESATPMYDNLFTAYDSGNDIVIGNRTYNKTEYGKAVHITSSNSSINASYDGGENTARIYFVDPNVNATYDFKGNVADMVIIGAIPGTRSKLTVNQQIKLSKADIGTSHSGQFVVYNIDFDATTLGNYPLAQNFDGNFEYVMFNDCYIKCNPDGNRPLSYISPNNRGFADFNMIGCHFEAGSATQNYVINASSSTMNYGNLTFENNIFFTKENKGERFAVFNGSKTTVESVVFNNNTVVNLQPCNSSNALALIYVSIVKSVEMNDNLIYNGTAITNNCGLARIDAFGTTPPTSASIQRNLVSYPASGDFRWMSVNGDKTMTGIEPVTITTENPFSGGGTFDPENETFIPNSTYSSYGARQ